MANEQYFSLTPNQPKVLSAMTYQPNKQDKDSLSLVFWFDHNTAKSLKNWPPPAHLLSLSPSLSHLLHP